MIIESIVERPLKGVFALILVTLTVLCASVMAQEYTADYWHQKGDDFYKNNSYDLALRCYDKAIEIDPLDADTWHNKGNVLMELGRTKEADAAFAKANELGNEDSTGLKQVEKDTPNYAKSQTKPLVEYIETDFQKKGNGYVVFLRLYDKNDRYVVCDGTLTINYYSDKSHTEFVRSETFDVTIDGFGEYFLKIAPTVKSTEWESERILASVFPECPEDKLLCGWYYSDCIFTDSGGNKFQYDALATIF